MSKYEDLVKQARIAHEKMQLEEAISLYEKAFEEMIMVDDLVDLGLVYLDSKNPYKAITVFESVIKVFPTFPYGYYGLGLAYEEIGNHEQAVKSYEKAIERDITFAQAYFNIALIADDNNDTKKAYDYYKKTLLYNPNHFWANLNLGSFYEKNNYIDLALYHSQKAYQINPKEKMVAYNLGVIHGKLKEYEKAINFYLEEMEKPNSYLLAYLNIGLIYKDIYKDFEKAKYYYLLGIKKDKDNSTLWYNLGCLYIWNNDYDNGYNCLLYANIKDPTIKEYMEKDEELSNFRNTQYYDKLLKAIRGEK